MIVDLPLARWDEAERLKTALYRFAELKRACPPQVALHDRLGRPTGAVDFPSRETAEEFRTYWQAFRAQTRVSGGFLDV
jgi:hypothetical protein